MSDPKQPADQEPSKSVDPEERGHRVTSPSANDAGGEVPEPPEYGETIDDLDVPSDVEPDVDVQKPA